MRAIIIEEDRFVEFVEKARDTAELLKMNKPEHLTEVSDMTWRIMVQDVHKKFHYDLVTWAQSQGARCTR